MIRRPPSSTRTDTLFPYTTLFRSARVLFTSMTDPRLFPDLTLDKFTTAVGFDLEQALEKRSEEHTSELQSLMRISYAVFCLKKKTNKRYNRTNITTK